MTKRQEKPATQVLLVADNASHLVGFALDLMQRGYALSTAQNEQEALTQITTKPWDVVIVDQTPDAQGIVLVQQIHAHAPDLPIILILSTPDLHTINEAVSAGSYDLIFSPPVEPLLNSALVRACERRRLQREQTSQAHTHSRTAIHDINNYLAGILGIVQLHLSNTKLEDELRDDFEHIVESANAIKQRLDML